MPGTSEAIVVRYTNWRDVTAPRTITPRSIWFGTSPWHREPQWFLRAWDHEKRSERDFALRDMQFDA